MQGKPGLGIADRGSPGSDSALALERGRAAKMRSAPSFGVVWDSLVLVMLQNIWRHVVVIGETCQDVTW